VTGFFLLVAAAIPDHTIWDSLLKTYVNGGHRVDYARLKAEAAPRLDLYLEQVAAPWPASMEPAGKKAALINAYNALMVRWIVTHFPVASVWKTKKAFTIARHKVNGVARSLDQIEIELRAEGDPRIHAVLVCAARGCPPLRREAYLAATLDRQLDGNTRAWLHDQTLNSFDPSKRRASVSSIFKWYAGDFRSLRTFLIQYGPSEAGQCTSISYKDYDWGLNDSGSIGAGYSGLRMKWDYLRNH